MCTRSLPTRFHRQPAGLTLIEMIVTVSLSTLLMLVIMNSVVALYRTNDYSLAQVQEIASARDGVTAAVRDIREMTFAQNGAFPLVVKEEHRIGFYSDIDRDNSVEYVEFELSSTTLAKRIHNPTASTTPYDFSSPDETVIISEFVQNQVLGSTTFRYYMGDGTEATATTSIADIRNIQIELVVNVDIVRNPGEFTIRSAATPRNLVNLD